MVGDGGEGAEHCVLLWGVLWVGYLCFYRRRRMRFNSFCLGECCARWVRVRQVAFMFWSVEKWRMGWLLGEGCLHSSDIPWPVVENHQQQE